MGLASDFGRAFAKAQLGAGGILPTDGIVFVSVKDSDKEAFSELVRDLAAMDFEVVATRGTAQFLAKKGIEVKTINKVLEGNPHVVDSMIDGNIQLVFNTTEGAQAIEDSFLDLSPSMYILVISLIDLSVL